MSRRGLLLFLALGIFWGFPYLFIRVAVREVSPATLVFLRTAPAALLLAPFSLRRGSLRPLLNRWRPIVAFSAIEVALPWLLLSTAEQKVASSFAGLLISTVPIIGAVLAFVTRSEHRLSIRSVIGVLVGFLGVVLLVGVDVRSTNGLAVFEIMVTALGYALGPMIVSRFLSDLPSLAVLTAAFALTGLAYAPYGLSHLPSRLDLETVGALAGLVIICTVIAFVSFFALIAEIGPVRSTVVTYINPAVALVLGIGLLGEHLTLGITVGFPTILLGSYLSNRPPRRAGRIPMDAGDRTEKGTPRSDVAITPVE